MIILIPAYEPDERLVELVRGIGAARPAQSIVVVDDGSGAGYTPVFDTVRTLGAEVVTHAQNRGKGAALKTGFARIRTMCDGAGDAVVCADCDGQHTLVDIERVAAALADRPGEMVLGAREFAGSVPFRSRLGNDCTRVLFRWLTGLRLSDTQTGLRAYPSSMLDWLIGIPGDRFEYELEVLLATKRAGVAIHEVPIQTIYLDGNESSHFHPIRDSIRVYVPLVKYALSRLHRVARPR